MEDASRDSTFLTYFFADQDLVNPEDIQVNPYNTNYEGVVNRAGCFPGSTVDKYWIDWKVIIPESVDAGVDQNVRELDFETIFVVNSFDDLKAEDNKSGDLVYQILALDHSIATHIEPNWSAQDLTNGSALHAEMEGLTSGQTYEAVAFDRDRYVERRFGSEVSGLLKNMTPGGIQKHHINYSDPWSAREAVPVAGKAKKMNQNTYCGQIFHLPQVGLNGDQFYVAGETTAISHLRIKYEVSFVERNRMFDQS
jgi:hypothetical protein